MSKYLFFESDGTDKMEYGVFSLEEIREMVTEYKEDDMVDEPESHARMNMRYFAKNIETGETIEL